MKKWITLLLAASMLLSLVACGSASAPKQTTAVTTQPVIQATEPPTQTEAPTEALAKPDITYIPYEFRNGESYIDAIWAMDFWEVDFDFCMIDAMLNYAEGAENARATPLSMEVSDNGFHVEVDYTGTAESLDPETKEWTKKVEHLGIVDMYAAHADGLAYIGNIDPEDYGYAMKCTYPDKNGGETEVKTVGNLWMESQYIFYDLDEQDEMCNIVYVFLIYYSKTGHLYNIIYHAPEERNTSCDPVLLIKEIPVQSFQPETRTLTYGDFTFEMSQFAIQCGADLYVYDYRPGMSVSDWACSELNTDGWIPWNEDYVLSPELQYRVFSDYSAIEECHDTMEPFVAEEYDSRAAFAEAAASYVRYVKGFETTSQEELDRLGILATDGITEPVAHMVNAGTPLCTPGFRIVTKSDGRAAYRSIGFSDSLYLLDDIMDIYMNGIADELIPHIKLYAFPESQEFLDTLKEAPILNVHPTPLAKDSEMLTIPEDAVCLTFERVPDGQEAPNSPNPRRPAHENLNKDAVYARYVTKDDPNFGEGVNLVFAITFDDELVYWIHMGRNFRKKLPEIQWFVYAMGY